MNIFKKFYIANLMLWAMMEKKPLTMILVALYYPILIGVACEAIAVCESLGWVDATNEWYYSI